jgi:Kef-type K+ transport system membrane component KefB
LIAGSSAAVAFPTIQERGLTGSAVALLIGWITVADAITALLLPLTLGSLRTMPIALLGDAIIIVIAGAALLVGERIRSHNAVIEANRRSKHRHWALQLRFAVLLMLVLAAVAERTSGSLLVAGFAAGIVLRRLGEPNRLTQQLTGLALGFFVPAFFVLLGAQLDLRALVTDPTAIWLAVAMALAAVAAHLIAGLIAGRELRIPAGLLASAQLGLPAAAAALGLATHTLRPAIAAALVAGGCLTLVPATVGAALMAGRQGADRSAAGSGAR